MLFRFRVLIHDDLFVEISQEVALMKMKCVYVKIEMKKVSLRNI